MCYGTTSNGYLKQGVKLPGSGTNFEGYSSAADLAGRTYVHSEVREIGVQAYKSLETGQPGKVFKYAETGFTGGGEFKPHKTHRNGLGVDFMVPVLNQQGESEHLPTHLFNKPGYDIEFGDKGVYKQYTIDYEAMAVHIAALHEASLSRGYDLWRVLFAPELQAHLFDTRYVAYLKEHVQFSKLRSWVRHDGHYHVDFSIPCQ